MKNYDAIITLSPEYLEKFLDQVFLTGFNTGYQSLIDPDLSNENRFNSNWLNEEVEEHPLLVENETGESLIIKPLAEIVMRIMEFDIESTPEDISWQSQIVMPKSIDEEEQEAE